jgi:hypothetical protein
MLTSDTEYRHSTALCRDGSAYATCLKQHVISNLNPADIVARYICNTNAFLHAVISSGTVRPRHS